MVFNKVSFAFDEHVVLRDVSFSVPKGSMHMLLGASGAGKSVVLKLALGLFRPDSGTILLNGERVDHLPEHELLRIRGDIGMLFQESALFDSLTVAGNVGYRLCEDRSPSRRGSEPRIGGAGVRRARRIHRPDAVRAVRRAAASCRDCPRHGDQAAPPVPRRPDDRIDPVIATTVDDEIVKLRDLEHVTSISSRIRSGTRLRRHA